MKKILVTGSGGFVGKNLCAKLGTLDNVQVLTFTRKDSNDTLASHVNNADIIFHLAGVNRPENDEEFAKDNTLLTKNIVALLEKKKTKTQLIVTSSTQALLDNPYGKSKLDAENIALEWAKASDNLAFVYRLPGVFGKWCKPNYNSVVATFCYNIAHNLPITINDPKCIIKLAYIDTVIKQFTDHLANDPSKQNSGLYAIESTFDVSLGELSERIKAIHAIRSSLIVPNLDDALNKYLYATYISYLETDDFSYSLNKNTDNRGWLAEFVKSKQFGQIFISKTKPGISRGDHWHNTKIEKFLVVEGDAEITFRNKTNSQDIIRYQVTGEDLTVLDIPTGYVHAIRNTGETDLLTIFWANEILDKAYPDTYYEKVENGD